MVTSCGFEELSLICNSIARFAGLVNRKMHPVVRKTILIHITFALLILCPISGHAAEPSRLPPGVTCETVKGNYEQWSHLGKRAIRLWLSLNGYTKAQQREAEKCLQ